MLQPQISKLTVVVSITVFAITGAVLIYHLKLFPSAPTVQTMHTGLPNIERSAINLEGQMQEFQRLMQLNQQMRNEMEEQQDHYRQKLRALESKNAKLQRTLVRQDAAQQTALTLQSTQQQAAMKKAIDAALRQVVIRQDELQAEYEKKLDALQNPQVPPESTPANVISGDAVPEEDATGPLVVTSPSSLAPQPVMLPADNPAEENVTVAPPAAPLEPLITQPSPAELREMLKATGMPSSSLGGATIDYPTRPYDPSANGASKYVSTFVTMESQPIKTGLKNQSVGYFTGASSSAQRQSPVRRTTVHSSRSHQVKTAHPPTRPIKRFTINSGATLRVQLLNSVNAFVPVRGQVAPYHVFAIVLNRRDNPATSGFYLPAEINEMKIIGQAIGDDIFQCAQVLITKVSFAFTDGTLREVPAPSSNPFGFLASAQSQSCLPGELRENVNGYAARTAMIGALTDVTQALTNTLSNTLRQNEQLNAFSTSGFQQGVTDWGRLQKDIADETVFAAVYVPASYRIEGKINPLSGTEYWPMTANFMVLNPIEIDYEPNGRKLIHETANPSRISRLD